MRIILLCAAALFLVACEATQPQQPDQQQAPLMSAADSVALAARIDILTDSMRVNYWERQLDWAREAGDTAIERQILDALRVAREGKAPPPILLTAADTAAMRQRIAAIVAHERAYVLEKQLDDARAAGDTALERQILAALERAEAKLRQ